MISNKEQVKLSDIIAPSYKKWYKATKEDKYLKYVLKGGRGSAKSTHIAIKLVLELIKYPITILCVRKVGNTLQESCFEQIKDVINLMDLNRFFKFNVNPLKITYTPRGNTVIFRGADNPAKIKSIKMSKYPITHLWIEELAEFKQEEDVSMIENSILRAELPSNLKYSFYYSYNPPKRKQSWVNKKYESSLIPENTHIFHTTFLDNPYISKTFIEEAEHVKKINPQKYDWEYLGKPIGSGVVPFSNLNIRKISDEEIQSFDNLRIGIDWGYAVDPAAAIQLHYDKTRRRIYVYKEIYKVQLSNRKLSELMKQLQMNESYVLKIADSAEPKSINELRDYGISNLWAARKGPGSVEHGEKWLNDLEEIIIDPYRCPNTAKEFETIDYKLDRFGEPTNKLEDKNNHTIDSIRYALERDMSNAGFSFN